MKIYAFIYALICFVFYGCATKQNKTNKPNILFIMMDDLGYGQFGIYNDTITTSDFNPYFVHLVDSLQGYSLNKSLEFSKRAIPELSRLANDGVIFTKAFTSSNICAPSRMGIATGINQNIFGVYTNTDAEEGGLLPKTHLAENLKNNGYYTAHIGKWHIGRRNNRIVKDILSRNNLDENISFYTLKKSHPDIYKEIINSGYLGSVVDEHNPLNNGFTYYYGYNHWSCDFYNAKNVWENFNHVKNQREYNTDVFTDKAIEAINKSVDTGKPFYIQLHYHAVHDSLEPKAPEKYLKKFDSGSYDLDNFYAHVNAVDSNVKRIVDFLKSNNQYKNTLIVFTSDNGAMAAGSYNGDKTGSPLPGNTPFSGHKGTFFQGGFRVPMFLHWPNGIKNPKSVDLLISTMDILPTAIEVAEVTVPSVIDGKSLFPILNGDDKPLHDHLIWSGIHSYKWGYLITKTTKTHGTESNYAPPAWVVVRGDYLLRFTGLLEKGIYKEHLGGRGPVLELFNIKNDPAELYDLSKQLPDLVNEMAALYFKESHSFKPPIEWKKSKWEEMQVNPILK